MKTPQEREHNKAEMMMCRELEGEQMKMKIAMTTEENGGAMMTSENRPHLVRTGARKTTIATRAGNRKGSTRRQAGTDEDDGMTISFSE